MVNKASSWKRPSHGAIHGELNTATSSALTNPIPIARSDEQKL